MSRHSQQVAYRLKPLTTSLVVLAAFIMPLGAPAQNTVNGMLSMGFSDMAAIKRNAEAGDPAAQVALANALASQFHSREALDWYRKAAAQGNAVAQFSVGEALLFGRVGIPNTQSVQPNIPDGIRWTYMAATNGHSQACYNMAKVLKEGRGTSPNLIAAYAWLKLYCDKHGAVGRVYLNELALKMDTASISQAEALAARFQAGQWQTIKAQTLPQGDPRLKLSGITYGGKTPLAVISGKTLSEGETATLPLKPSPVAIKCLKIEKESVLISVEGEDTPRRLSLR